MTWKSCEPQVLGHTLGALFRSYESDRAIFAIWSWTRPMGIMASISFDYVQLHSSDLE